jgi:hypothetical protein
VVRITAASSGVIGRSSAGRVIAGDVDLGLRLSANNSPTTTKMITGTSAFKT